MNTQLLIDDRKGNIFEIPHLNIELKTERVGRAGSLEFSYIGGDVFSIKINIENGNVALLKIDGNVVFYGYVFKVSGDGDGVKKVVCYDQLRYLKNSDSKVFINKKASDILKSIAKENSLKTGKVTDAKYAIPKCIQDNEEYFDLITKSLQDTTLATGRLYLLRDNVGSIELLDVADTKLDIVIDGDGLLTDFSTSKSIDDDTFNRIKLIKEDEDSGTRKVYIDQDSSTISKWGRLQYFEKVDNKMNDAQIKEKARNLLKFKNREKKTLKLNNCKGDIRCVAGFSVYIIIPEEDIKGFYLIDKASHSIEDSVHTMSLELVVV